MADTEQGSPSSGKEATWWEQKMARRKAMKTIGGITAGIVGIAAVGGIIGYAVSDNETEVDSDTLDIQREHGWNVGAEDTQLVFENAVTTDSAADGNVQVANTTRTWSDFRAQGALMTVYRPHSDVWKPYYVGTALDATTQETFRNVLVPVHSQAMDIAYSQGLGMKELLSQSKQSGKTAIIVDVPGPEAVSFATALAPVAELVPVIDNFPHPQGVVPTHNTLGALLYYAREYEHTRSTQTVAIDNTVCFILDGRRLTEYKDDTGKFDNRYLAKLPSAEQMQSHGITNLMYVVANDTIKQETDDLNDYFTAYKDKGINVSLIPITNFQKGDDKQMTQQQTQPGYRPTYYYGGYPYTSLWFFYHYPSYGYYGSLPPQRSLRNVNVSRPAYQPTARSTIFSSRTTGGASGVGRQKPAGFGRVSTRMTGSGQLTGIRSGRSGSFGRVRGGSFS